MWKTSIREEDILIPENPKLLDAILGRSKRSSLTHKGIELNCLFYNSLELQDLRRRHGARLEVEVKIDAADIGSIIVISPDQRELIKVPALLHRYATGLSEWQHKIIRKFAAREHNQDGDAGWLEAKTQISEMIDREFLRMKVSSKKRIARYLGDEQLLKTDAPETKGPPVRTRSKKKNAVASEAVAATVPPAPAPVEAPALSARTDEVNASTPKPGKKNFKFTYRPRGPEPLTNDDEVPRDD
jgi:putative transposase